MEPDKNITTLIIIQAHGHLLLAANLNEFKSIAKQFVPENLANQLAGLASNIPVKYRVEQQESEEEESESYSETVDTEEVEAVQSGQGENVKEVHVAKINFEELVQKVKERIEKDFETQKKVIVEPKGAIFAPQFYEKNLRQVSRLANDSEKKTKEPLTNPNLAEVDIPLNESPVQGENLLFAKTKLKEHDSYEDYITPAKEKDIFDGEMVVKKIDDIQTTTLRQVPEYKNQEMDYGYYDKTEELKAKSGEMKAKTEDLVYDYKQTTVTTTEDYRVTSPKKRKKTTKAAKGTMIPKRDFYKISSPNYFAKVPIVAEKYDFNEPIPENDREPESLKPVRGLPVNINGKIKLTD